MSSAAFQSRQFKPTEVPKLVQSIRSDLVAAGLDMTPDPNRKRRAKNSDGSRDARPEGAMIKHRPYRGSMGGEDRRLRDGASARDGQEPSQNRTGPRLSQAERSNVMNAQKMNAQLTKGGSTAGGLGLSGRFDLPPVAPSGTWPVTGSPR